MSCSTSQQSSEMLMLTALHALPHTAILGQTNVRGQAVYLVLGGHRASGQVTPHLS